MKIRSSIHAGAQGGCPEAQHYQQKALAMAQKVYNCVPRNQAYCPACHHLALCLHPIHGNRNECSWFLPRPQRRVRLVRFYSPFISEVDNESTHAHPFWSSLLRSPIR